MFFAYFTRPVYVYNLFPPSVVVSVGAVLSVHLKFVEYVTTDIIIILFK
jgi:hypothetical protein